MTGCVEEEREREREKEGVEKKLGLSELLATVDHRKRHPLPSLTAPLYNHQRPKIRKKEFPSYSTSDFTFLSCPAKAFLVSSYPNFIQGVS